MTDRLADIQARLDAATPGPWSYFVDKWHVHEIRTNDDETIIGVSIFVAEDAEFIANAPTDITYLLERVRMWRALAEDAIAEFDEVRSYVDDYFINKWGYTVKAAEFAQRRRALTEGASE